MIANYHGKILNLETVQGWSPAKMRTIILSDVTIDSEHVIEAVYKFLKNNSVLHKLVLDRIFFDGVSPFLLVAGLRKCTALTSLEIIFRPKLTEICNICYHLEIMLMLSASKGLRTLTLGPNLPTKALENVCDGLKHSKSVRVLQLPNLEQNEENMKLLGQLATSSETLYEIRMDCFVGAVNMSERIRKQLDINRSNGDGSNGRQPVEEIDCFYPAESHVFTRGRNPFSIAEQARRQCPVSPSSSSDSDVDDIED